MPPEADQNPVAPNPIAAVTAPEAAPPSAAPAPVPSSEPAPAPAAAPEPAAAPVEAKEPAPAAPERRETLLERYDREQAEKNKPAEPAKPEGDKPAEPEKKADAAPTDAKPPEPAKPAETPKTAEELAAEAETARKAADEAAAAEAARFDYSKIEVPEGIKSGDEKFKGFTDLLGEHKITADVGQKLLGMHSDAIKAVGEHALSEQKRIWSETQESWIKDAMADHQIGGAGFQTSLGAIARMRDLAVPEKDRAAFNDFLYVTGAGNHPAFLKMMHNFARYFDEPGPPPPNPKPLPNGGAQPSRRAAMYDHPSSQKRQ